MMLRSQKTEDRRQKTEVRVLLFSVLCFLSSVFSSIICFAQSISSTELISEAKQYDNQTIVYEGEIIGDIMRRTDTAWLNVYDGENAIGINCSKDLIEGLDLFAGGYNKKGDWVKINGIFNNVCINHGGDLDIHASSLEIVKKGKYLSENINPQKKQLVSNLIGALLCLLILKFFLTKRRRQ